jgi:hypothetical protein
MVPAGDDIDPGGKDFVSRLWRDAGAARGIFAVRDNEMDPVCFPQPGYKLLDGTASGLAHNVADEKQFHAALQ